MTALQFAPTPATINDPFVGRDMLCFSHDWTGDPLSKTHLMRLLARDNRILWVNSIGYRAPNFGSKQDLGRIARKIKQATEPVREVERNIFVLNPLAIPGVRSPWLRKWNSRFLSWQIRRATSRLRFKRPINWVFNPAAGDVAGTLGESEIVYYCVDEYTKFSGVDTSTLLEIERRLIEKSNLVVVSAERLMQPKSSSTRPAVLLRHGVDYDHFRTALDADIEIPGDLKDLPKPVIGYFGLMSEDWIDLPLLVHLAKSLPNCTLVMLGKSTMDMSELERLPNVRLLGRKPYDSLPAYCKGFDVSIIPFPISEVTLNANPLKAREYLAAGLPVVSTAIPEVEALDSCLIAKSPEEFVSCVMKALRHPGPNLERSATMRSESWSARIEELKAAFASVQPRASGGGEQ